MTTVTHVILSTAMREANAPKLLYRLWKIPSPDAMWDNFGQAGSMIAKLASETGEVLEVRQGTGLESKRIMHHPVTGEALVGMTLPHWDKVPALAEAVHSHFPD